LQKAKGVLRLPLVETATAAMKETARVFYSRDVYQPENGKENI
jgi:hypothetical protein